MESYVSINLKKEEIVIRLSDKTAYEKVVESLKKKLPELKKFYQKETMPLHIVGRELKKSEIKEITAIIKKEMDVEIYFDSSEELGLHGIKKPYEKDVSVSEALFYRGSVRSGQKVQYEGSIVILGDVNGGGEVIAGDNIVVLGSLRGLAHAGAKGNKKAIISAHLIDTPQLRIAQIIKEIERSDETIFKMACAVIVGEEIVVK